MDLPRHSLIPLPRSCEPAAGCFDLSPTTRIVTAAEAEPEAALLAERLRPATGFPLPVSVGAEPGAGDITLSLGPGTMAAEGYELVVDATGIRLLAATRQGLFYATQSLLQLLPEAVFRRAEVAGVDWRVPGVRLVDQPRFRWRGLHLDSARHFMPKGFILKLLDLMALHKLNSFHWHLTEDQGWRLEIPAYPRLMEVAAWRPETVVGHHGNRPRFYDGRPHGGFYTRDDVREVVAYAARRHIRVVPEIEMPGHSQAVLAAYPEFGCTGGPYQVRTTWGISDEVYCAGNEQVFTFLEDVLTEVMDLFPGEFIHIGGDECPKARWRECPKCQARIRAEGLKDEDELQSYVIRRIERFLNARGRRLIGWDEILEGGLAPNATVMSWRGEKGGIAAANAGHDVVFAPNSHTYFDHCQGADLFAEPLSIGGHLPLSKVYAYEPIPTDLKPEQATHVLGAQGQLWSEYLPTPQQVEYMAFPRASALAEVLWSQPDARDYDHFLARLPGMLRRLDVLDVNYRRVDQ